MTELSDPRQEHTGDCAVPSYVSQELFVAASNRST